MIRIGATTTLGVELIATRAGITSRVIVSDQIIRIARPIPTVIATANPTNASSSVISVWTTRSAKLSYAACATACGAGNTSELTAKISTHANQSATTAAR